MRAAVLHQLYIERAGRTRKRCVGVIQREPNGDVVLLKTGLDPLWHRLHTPPAWAVDVNHVAQLRAASAGAGTPARIVLRLVTGESLEITLENFDRHSFPTDRGHGLQRAVVEARWAVRRPDGSLVEPEARAPATAPRLATRTPRTPGVEQLRLLDASSRRVAR